MACNGIFFIDGLGWVGLRKLDPGPCLFEHSKAKQVTNGTFFEAQYNNNIILTLKGN